MDACTCVVVGVIAIIVILALVLFIWKPCSSMDQFYGGADDINITRQEIVERSRRYERNLVRQARNEELGDTLDKYKMNAFSRVLVYNQDTFEAVKKVLGLDDSNLSYISDDGTAAYYKWTQLDSIIENAYGQTPSNRITTFLRNVSNFMDEMVQKTDGAFLVPTTHYGQIVFYMHVLYETLSKNNADTKNHSMIKELNEKELLPYDIEDTPAMVKCFRAISLSMERIWTSFVIPFNEDMYSVDYDTARIMFKNIGKPTHAIQRLFIDPLADGRPRNKNGFVADLTWLFNQILVTADLNNLQ